MNPWSEKYPLQNYMRDRLDGIPVAPALNGMADEEPQDLFVRLWSAEVKKAFHGLCDEEAKRFDGKGGVRGELLARMMKLAMLKKDGYLAKRLFRRGGNVPAILAGTRFEGWSLLHWGALLVHRTLPKSQAAAILNPLLDRRDEELLETVVGLSDLKRVLDQSEGRSDYDEWVSRLLESLSLQGKRTLIFRLLDDYQSQFPEEPERLENLIRPGVSQKVRNELSAHIKPLNDGNRRREYKRWVAKCRMRLGTQDGSPIAYQPGRPWGVSPAARATGRAA